MTYVYPHAKIINEMQNMIAIAETGGTEQQKIAYCTVSALQRRLELDPELRGHNQNSKIAFTRLRNHLPAQLKIVPSEYPDDPTRDANEVRAALDALSFSLLHDQ